MAAKKKGSHQIGGISVSCFYYNAMFVNVFFSFRFVSLSKQIEDISTCLHLTL